VIVDKVAFPFVLNIPRLLKPWRTQLYTEGCIPDIWIWICSEKTERKQFLS